MTMTTSTEKARGEVVTRFPPEPNGFLHIGHAKAMLINFGAAADAPEGGRCILRMDDTNPETAQQDFADAVVDAVAWLGWRPCAVTHASDVFERLYELATQLVREGRAYVCHQTRSEIEACRAAKRGSPWRGRPAEESLRLFEDMRRGAFADGAATLRLMMHPAHDNPAFSDPVAYRVKRTPHPRTGDAWCVYPSYDFAHCVVDSLEGVTHSLCTLEFETRRPAYFWVLDALRLRAPEVREYARLNLARTVTSKRKLRELVRGEYVRGWDDPRMPTLAGLRRRGVRPEAINAFCREVGATRSETLVAMHRLEHHVRVAADAASPRALAVLRPLRVTLLNVDEAHLETVTAQRFPGRQGSPTYELPLTRTVYIERGDFSTVQSDDGYGLAPGRRAMLRYACVVRYVSHHTDATGAVTGVAVEVERPPQGAKAPKGVLNWVAEPTPGREPPRFEARIFDDLFLSDDPCALGHLWLADRNPRSLEVLEGCLASPGLADAAAGDCFQLERQGYFCVDPDSRPGHLVLNRTATLRASKK